ncbi:hypothetical protein E4198_17485 [Streptomyces sp. RKND-216]|uniref:Uncharacterized protein n=1 Tax=Streptomyces hazeniae TaxID=3075538 RepID=A0ABU2NLG5_9ACTN|nr:MULTISPECIES: hypothetical protein [unclassified Streptomyces]MDT0377820.1 hypothetical protein [Streptomyces sp. DSM 42041]THA26242.1 hypothetical protein E4198_17485 [Streptomyces sp. RKND-216]
MLPIDPHADRSRRAWVDCPRCADNRGCVHCAGPRACTEHWRYLLAHRGRRLQLQCPTCAHLWEHDTGFGYTPRRHRR